MKGEQKMKGMRKIKRGKGFRGATSYAINREPGDEPGQIIGGNMSSSTPKKLAAEFGVSRKLRPDIEKPVWHNSLRLPKGEHIPPEKLVVIADEYMKKMGFTDMHQRLYVMHDDPDGQHVHIVASRVSLNGSVYLGRNENLESTRHIQALEREHNLIITKGPALKDGKVVMPDKKRPKQGEDEMALATGKRPARSQLQDLVDNALKTPCTAVEFVKRLNLAGVEVRPNIASTGTMNGFSFKLKRGGVPFTGSKLGDIYKWEKLQKRGVEYDKARDSRELADIKRLAAVHFEPGSDSSSVDRYGAESGGYQQGTEGRDNSNDRATTSSGRADNVPGDRESDKASHPDKQVSADNRPAAGSLDSPGRAGKDEHKSPGQEGFGPRKGDGDSGGPDKENPAKMVGSGPVPAPVGDSQRGSRGDRLSRFRISSASKRLQAGRSVVQETLRQSQTGRVERDTSDIKSIDPTPYLESQGFNVVKEGRHHSVKLAGDEVYRLTEKPDGRWLWCDNYGNRGGDNLDLVKELEPQKSFGDRVYTLRDESRPTASSRPKPRSRPTRKPKLPHQDQKAVKQGREYLLERKMSQEVIERAEQQGFLKYCSDGVFFCGYDENGEIAAATKRAIDAAAEVQKKDLFGTDKSCPPILHGGSDVWIVEGGADALALQNIKERAGDPRPTVIVSGGARVYSFLERPEIRELLKGARSVTVAYELEDTPEKQMQTDAGHDKQKGLVAEITGKEVGEYRPGGLKDLAAVNEFQAKDVELQELTERSTPDNYGLERYPGPRRR